MRGPAQPTPDDQRTEPYGDLRLGAQRALRRRPTLAWSTSLRKSVVEIEHLSPAGIVVATCNEHQEEYHWSYSDHEVVILDPASGAVNARVPDASVVGVAHGMAICQAVDPRPSETFGVDIATGTTRWRWTPADRMERPRFTVDDTGLYVSNVGDSESAWKAFGGRVFRYAIGGEPAPPADVIEAGFLERIARVRVGPTHAAVMSWQAGPGVSKRAVVVDLASKTPVWTLDAPDLGTAEVLIDATGFVARSRTAVASYDLNGGWRWSEEGEALRITMSPEWVVASHMLHEMRIHPRGAGRSRRLVLEVLDFAIAENVLFTVPLGEYAIRALTFDGKELWKIATPPQALGVLSRPYLFDGALYLVCSDMVFAYRASQR